MAAVIRRILLIAGVFGALYAALAAQPPLLRVEAADFGAPVARGPNSLLGRADPESPDQRTARKTEGRLA